MWTPLSKDREAIAMIRQGSQNYHKFKSAIKEYLARHTLTISRFRVRIWEQESTVHLLLLIQSRPESNRANDMNLSGFVGSITFTKWYISAVSSHFEQK